MATASTVAARELPKPLETNRSRLGKAEISRIISFSRISLIVGLVFLHYGRYPNVPASPFAGVNVHGFELATFINSFVLFFFFSVVPLLSMVSGWLFFSFREHAATEIASRIRRRFVSLYVPLVLWNLFYLVLLWALFTVDGANPLLADLNIDFATARPAQYVNAVFALTQHPVGFQFWFVRDLFATVLVSPLLWMLLKSAPRVGAVALALVWISNFDLWIFFRTDVLFFFYLGGLVRQRGIPLEVTPRATLWVLIAYLLLVTLRTLAPYVIDDEPLLDLATKLMRLVGVLACWGVFQVVALSAVGSSIARYGGFAFFLHAIHFPLIAAIKVLLWPAMPAETQGWMLVHYGASVFLTVSFGMAMGIWLAKWAPQPFAVLNGGRLANAGG
jgi:hypothetical protein